MKQLNLKPLLLCALMLPGIAPAAAEEITPAQALGIFACGEARDQLMRPEYVAAIGIPPGSEVRIFRFGRPCRFEVVGTDTREGRQVDFLFSTEYDGTTFIYGGDGSTVYGRLFHTFIARAQEACAHRNDEPWRGSNLTNRSKCIIDYFGRAQRGIIETPVFQSEFSPQRTVAVYSRGDDIYGLNVRNGNTGERMLNIDLLTEVPR